MRTSNAVSTPAKRQKQVSAVVKRKRKPIAPTIVRMGRQPFAKQLFCTLRYVESFSTTMSLGVGGKYQFSCNGMFDPNITGTGHQPMYFDQLMAIYDHYTVLRSRVSFQPVTGVVAAGRNLIAGAYIEDDTTGARSATSAIESPDGRGYAWNINVSAPPPIKLAWSGFKTFGGDVQADDQLQGTASANPTEQSYFTLTCDSYDLADSDPVKWLVRIEYDAVFDELKTIADS